MQPYEPGLTEPGAWSVYLDGAPRPLDTVHAAIRSIAATTPLSGWTYHDSHHPDSDVIAVRLYRHPSHTHGTPSVHDCASAGNALADLLNWLIYQPYSREVVTSIGLREGYDATATTHPLAVVADILNPHLGCALVTQWSARAIDGDIQWYDEPAALVRCGGHPSEIARIERAAAATRQHQIVITDHIANEVRTLRQPA